MRPPDTKGHAFLFLTAMVTIPVVVWAQESEGPAPRLEVLWQFQTGG